MIKIVSANQIREAEQATLITAPISSLDLMERAAKSCCHWLVDFFPVGSDYVFFCGKGNNGNLLGLCLTVLLVGGASRSRISKL